jgi:hypothetical protein
VKLQPDGTREEIFTSWDVFDVDPSVSITWNSGYYGSAKDWTHANGLYLNESADRVLVSFLGVSTVLEVDLATGEVLWTFSGLDLAEPKTQFQSQHSPVWSDTDKIKLFINAPLLGDQVSYAAEIDLSLDPPQEVWNSGRADSSRFTQALGRVSQLRDGHTLINYGYEGQLEEVDSLGRAVWRWTLDDNWLLGETLIVTLFDD